jgi:uncharacterized membrane protein
LPTGQVLYARPSPWGNPEYSGGKGVITLGLILYSLLPIVFSHIISMFQCKLNIIFFVLFNGINTKTANMKRALLLLTFMLYPVLTNAQVKMNADTEKTTLQWLGEKVLDPDHSLITSAIRQFMTSLR